MKLTITNFLFGITLAANLVGCGSLTSDQVFTIEMYGLSKSPASATGTRDPNFQNYQLLKVSLVGVDTQTVTTLFDNEDERIFRVVDRTQIIYSKKIADEAGNSFSKIQVTFAPEIEGGVSSDASSTFTMTTPQLELVETFEIQKAKDVDILIKINWGNTISDEGMTEPEYIMTKE